MSERADPDAAGGSAVAAILERLASARTLRITTRGRKSGLPRHATIWFVVDGPTIGVGTLNEERNWVRNAHRNPDVELDVAGTRLRGRFSEIAEPGEHARVRAALARKYWPARIASWFGIGQRHTFRIGDLAPLGGSVHAAGTAPPKGIP
ncbi:MAG TPA: nitroreductase/quinone reductase family protein [Candidatus Binatia bacterium]|nr:nitroreductase/quinone reductase family protein [Candidatus Binatia bacterium]